MDFARITKALEETVGAVVKARETVDEVTATLEDMLWTAFEKVEEFKAGQTQSADEAQPSQAKVASDVERTLKEKLDFILINIDQTDGVKAVRSSERLRDNIIEQTPEWIERQYAEIFERLYNSEW